MSQVMDSGQVRGALLALALVLIVGFGALLVLRPVQQAVAPSGGAGAPMAPAALPAPVPIAPAPNPMVLPSSPMASPPAPAASVAPPDSLEDVVARALPAVVSIQAGGARGTGFFVRPDVVLTNHHVIAGQSFVELTSGTAKY